MEGAGVNIADVIVRTGMNVQYGATSEREQYGLGSEFAGTVDELGAGVTGVSVGDAVIGTQERLDTALGSQAELVVVDSWALAPAPVGSTSIEAAGLPLPGITALQALDTLALEPGQTLLVTGAAGGVGGYAVELGVLRGLRVIAHAAAAEEDRLRSMGAELFVPRDVHLADTVRDLVPGGADGALDAANLVTAADDAVRHGGRSGRTTSRGTATQAACRPCPRSRAPVGSPCGWRRRSPSTMLRRPMSWSSPAAWPDEWCWCPERRQRPCPATAATASRAAAGSR